MIPQEILEEAGNLARSDHPQAIEWATGKLLEIIQVQDARIDDLEARIAELESRG